MDLGVQLFGVLAAAKMPAREVLPKLQELGYTHVEPCLAPEPIGTLENVIWPLQDFDGYMEILAGLNLKVNSVHVIGRALNRYTGRLRELAEKWGIRYFVVKTPENADALCLQETSIAWMTLADELREAGAGVLLHNEAADIAEKTERGETLCEHLLDLCQGRVGLQADVGWLMRGGEDVPGFLRRNQDRIRSVHFKDFDSEGKEVTVGEGVLPLRESFAFARAFGLPQLVDQDSFSGDPFAVLSEVRERMSGLSGSRTRSKSYLNIMDYESGEIRTVAAFDRVIEAPNWLSATGELIYNADGLLYAWKDGTERKIETGTCTACNNDHVLSPDGKAIAVSHMTFGEEGFTSRIYVVPFSGGEPRLVTPESPSFLHGWSPDGTEMAYCAFREHGGKREVDVYTIPVQGGAETRRTFGGFNDGPEYSPDGKHIWFNSTRTGLMQVWRMNRDGSDPVRMTRNEDNCWFGHVSPDGRKVVYIVYPKGHLQPDEHLPDMQCELWGMNADGSGARRLCSLFGGQGTINVNSWAPDSRHFAFVSYERI